MSTDVIDVDTYTYYEAAAVLGRGAVAFGKAFDTRWQALADCAHMTGSYDDAKAWALDYDARADEAIDTAVLLAEAARGYAVLLTEMGHNHALADHASVIDNPWPAPHRPPDPEEITLSKRPPLPSAGGPGQGLITEGLSAAIDLLDEIDIIIPDGDTGKLGNAHRIWSEMAADPAVAGFSAELSRLADMFATVTTSEAVFIDEDLRAMSTAAAAVTGMMGEIAAAAEDHRAGLEDMRTKLGEQLKQLAIDMGTEALIGVGLTIVTAGFGAAVATARATNAVRKFAGPIRNLITTFKSMKLAKGVKTTHQAATHQPTLKQLAALKPQKASTGKPPAHRPRPKDLLTEDEHIAINSYTGMGFKDINQVLRNPLVDPDPAQQARIDALNEALGKLPNHEGPVTRHTNLPPHILDQYQEGKTVTEAAFTSTSKNPAGANTLWPEASSVEMQIISKTGKDVSSLSKSPEEMEVLFASGTQFNCVQRFTDPVSGRTVLRLVEV
ncbi:ADP-ribosyltransferase [Nocardia sp. NPDC058499]|uniref:ADP-ribosyltransferase n=1 Tax=Nocardia sp. NPDC058499 TaxID=3346530 RepID=UPI00365D7DFC